MSKGLLVNRTNLFEDIQGEKSLRDGTEIKKGISLTTDYVEAHQKDFEKMINFFMAYPDLFLDLIKPADSNFNLFFYQRMVLRAAMRYKEIYITAPRAFSKSFISILALFLQCVFVPHSRRFIAAPQKAQGAEIAREKIIEIYEKFPLLRKEVVGGHISKTPGNFGKDYVKLTFLNGSTFEVVGALESTRGQRKHAGLIDEVRDQDEDLISKVVLPLMNVSRRMPNGEVNPKEPNQQQIYMTSAAQKTTFAYSKLIDVFENSIIFPNRSFCFGCDYRVPMMHGLLDKDYVNNLKMSPSFNETAFNSEYLSNWSGASKESWFNYDKMTGYRKIKNPENKAKLNPNAEQFYLMSVDVGRLHDSTVVSVFRVNIINDKFYSTLVNMQVLGRDDNSKRMQNQAADIKELIALFNPREVVIDTNGLGVGLGDEMIVPQVSKDGTELPAYGFINDERWKKTQPKDAPQILYSLKANASLNSQIHSNCYNRINNGTVRFLISEQEAKSALLATKVGQKMDAVQRQRRLIPHENTTALFEEMANLRLQRTSGLDIKLERINPRFPKDKYSSFSYGLWRIKELEEEYSKHRRRRGNGPRKLIFFTGGA